MATRSERMTFAKNVTKQIPALLTEFCERVDRGFIKIDMATPESRRIYETEWFTGIVWQPELPCDRILISELDTSRRHGTSWDDMIVRTSFKGESARKYRIRVYPYSHHNLKGITNTILHEVAHAIVANLWSLYYDDQDIKPVERTKRKSYFNSLSNVSNYEHSGRGHHEDWFNIFMQLLHFGEGWLKANGVIPNSYADYIG